MTDAVLTQFARDKEQVLDLGLVQPLTTINLADPQLLAIHHIDTISPRMILFLDKGMGKTLTYLVPSLRRLRSHPDEVLLILCTKNAMLSQIREIRKHFPDLLPSIQVVRGQGPQRNFLWAQKDKRIFIATYATFQADMGGRLKSKAGTATSSKSIPAWLLGRLDTIVCDEFHRVMRNRKSGLVALLKDQKCRSIILSSGSAVSSGPQDIFAALHILNPKRWSSYWAYIKNYCLVVDTGFGQKIIGVRNQEQWRKDIAPWMFFRRKDPSQYPPKMRSFLEVELEPWQRKLHDQLRQDLLAEAPNGDWVSAKTSLDSVYRARLALICPKALDESFGVGAGIEAIVEDAEESELTHYVITTPFKKPIQYLVEYLTAHKIQSYVLSGDENLGPYELEAVIEKWTRTGGVIIQTTLFAQSYELLAAKNMYMLGYEWDPEANKQAEDRLHRASSDIRYAINIYYVRHPYTYDEDQIESLMLKSNTTDQALFGMSSAAQFQGGTRIISGQPNNSS